MKLSWVGKLGIGLIAIAILILVAAYFLGFLDSPAATSRAKLKTALDAWVAQTSATKFQDAHPEIAFSDVDMMQQRLLRYEIASPSTNEGAFVVFTAKLAVLKDGKELELPRAYKVSRVQIPEGKKAWVILGHTD